MVAINGDNVDTWKDEDSEKEPENLLEALKILQDETGVLIPKEKIEQLAGFENLEENLTKLKRAGAIFEPKPNFYQIL